MRDIPLQGSASRSLLLQHKRAQEAADAVRVVQECVQHAEAIRQQQNFEVDAKAWEAQMFIPPLLPANEIAMALLKPVEKREGESWDLAFCKSMGLHGTKGAVRELLFGSEDLLDCIVDRIWDGLQGLAQSERATGVGLHDKFEADAKFTMAFASLDQFFDGLEEMVGAPDVKVMATMEHEHCREDDSHDPFTTGNYGVCTTSKVEWCFVALNLSSPPADPVKLDSGSTVKLELSGGWPAEDPAKCQHPRKPLSQQEAEQIFQSINSRLQGIKEPPLILEEFLGARLYTGPMFIKYNTTLRGGALNMSQLPFMEEAFEDLCLGNRYSTTIHAISSSIIKLGKLTAAGTVYRGFSGGVFPKEFLEKNEFGVSGAVECAFMSTTRDRSVAEQYAGTGVATVMQLEMGMIDRGADLSELSQYPAEKEVCFGPLTSLQVLSTSVDRSALLLNVRPNINLANTTMDKVLAKRRVMLVSMCKGLVRECMRFLSTSLWKSILQGKFFMVYDFLEAPDGYAEAQYAKIKDAARRASQAGETSGGLDGGMAAGSPSGGGIHEDLSGTWRSGLGADLHARVLLDTLKDLIPRKLQSTLQGYSDDRFTDDEFFKDRVADALDVKESVRLASSRVLVWAAQDLEESGYDEDSPVVQRARDMAAVLQEGEYGTVEVSVTLQDVKDAGAGWDSCANDHLHLFLQSLGLEMRSGCLYTAGFGALQELQVGSKLGAVAGPDGKDLGAAACCEVDTLETELDRHEQLTMTFHVPISEVEVMSRFKELLQSRAVDSVPEALSHMASRYLQLHHIQNVELPQFDLGGAKATMLVRALASCRNLQVLDLSDCEGMSEAGVVALINSFQKLESKSQLRQLSLLRSGLGAAAGEALAGVLPQLPGLQVLWVNVNPDIGDAAGAAMIQSLAAIGADSRLRDLYLNDCGLGAAAAGALAALLPQLHGLQRLWLGSNPDLGDAGGAAICRALAQQGEGALLCELDLTDCGLGATAVEALVGLLPQLHSLLHLWLYNNPLIGDAGGASLCRVLARQGPKAPLRELGLQYCGLGTASAHAVAEVPAGMLLQLSALQKLDLRNNSLGDDGVAAVCQAFQNFNRETSLDKSGLQLVDCGAAEKAKKILGKLPRAFQELIALEDEYEEEDESEQDEEDYEDDEGDDHAEDGEEGGEEDDEETDDEEEDEDE